MPCTAQRQPTRQSIERTNSAASSSAARAQRSQSQADRTTSSGAAMPPAFCTTSVPIDTDIAYLIILGVAFGAYQIHKSSKMNTSAE
ncbi:hypothetical protein [Persicobacter psychrovividus]|uniref:Uncharacterized protein n=1 Tax=Persicobacter psychrovividus TaxID=387638 RepID=A0ABM7VER1_9BACT|nr:hypothetical protein PEPS_17250 [Persicobacter psychrovividus]